MGGARGGGDGVSEVIIGESGQSDDVEGDEPYRTRPPRPCFRPTCHGPCSWLLALWRARIWLRVAMRGGVGVRTSLVALAFLRARIARRT